MNRFEDINAMVLFVFLMLVLVPIMFVMDIYMAGVAWLGGICYITALKRKFNIEYIFYSVVAILIITLVNSLVAPRGTNIVLWVAGRSITLDSINYGATTGVMLVAAIIWCMILTTLMTTDHIVRLLRPVPRIGLLISMILKLVPEYVRRYKQVSEANKMSSDRRGFIKTTSAVFTYALESSGDTAETMMIRGYGNRKARKLQWHRADWMMLAVIVCFQGMYLGNELHKHIGFAVFCFIPILYNAVENIRWAIYRLKSKKRY